MARSPKDVCVSYHHHHKLFNAQEFTGTFDQFFDLFITDERKQFFSFNENCSLELFFNLISLLVLYSPYLTIVLEAWKQKDHSNMLFLHYEEMKQNPAKEISRIVEFLQTNLTPKQIEEVCTLYTIRHFLIL